VNAVNSISECGPALSQDPQVLDNAAAARQQLLSQLASLPGRSALSGPMPRPPRIGISPDGRRMNSPRAAPRTIKLTLTSRPRLPLTPRPLPTRRRSLTSGTR
jgi:hypothetical protein